LKGLTAWCLKTLSFWQILLLHLVKSPEKAATVFRPPSKNSYSPQQPQTPAPHNQLF
jgi:hypothetical protein